MAHVEKIKRNNYRGIFYHVERREGVELSNKDIDKSRTHLNYNLAKNIQLLSANQFLDNRINEVKHLNRKDIVVAVSWIITLPKDVREEDEEKFFIESFNFLNKKYGEKNVITAYVHKDETTAHMHYLFVPVTLDKNGNEKLCCKDIINRATLKKFHPELEKYLEERMGYCCGIQNGITEELGKSYTVKELKQETVKLKEEFENVILEIEESTDRLNTVIDYKENLVEELSELKASDEYTVLKLKERTQELEEKVTLLEMIIQFFLELMERFGLYELKEMCLQYLNEKEERYTNDSHTIR